MYIKDTTTISKDLQMNADPKPQMDGKMQIPHFILYN